MASLPICTAGCAHGKPVCLATPLAICPTDELHSLACLQHKPHTAKTPTLVNLLHELWLVAFVYPQGATWESGKAINEESCQKQLDALPEDLFQDLKDWHDRFATHLEGDTNTHVPGSKATGWLKYLQHLEREMVKRRNQIQNSTPDTAYRRTVWAANLLVSPASHS